MSRGADKDLTDPNLGQGRAALSAVGMVLGGYESGFELVEGLHRDAIERFVVLRVRGTPRLMLPPEGPVMKSAITSFLGNRHLAGIATPLVQAASWAGGPLSRVSSNLSLLSEGNAPSPLRKLIADILGRDDFQFALRLSFGRPNAKMVAMAVSGTGEALCFAKFGSESMTNGLVAHESAVLERFEDSDLPIVMPRRLYSGTWAGGHNVLVTAPLQLEALDRDAHSAHQAADRLASRNLVTSAPLAESTYWRRLLQEARGFGEGGEEDGVLLSFTREIERNWGDRVFDFGASHGDWARANLGMVEGRLAALDWERCTEIAPRGIDVAHFALCENSFPYVGRSLDIERAVEVVRRHLDDVGLPSDNAETLVVLALLEMVIRFRSARDAGLRSADSRFEPALKAGLRKWAEPSPTP